MKRIILFSEMISSRARQAAAEFVENGDAVYALAGSICKEEPERISGVHYLEADRTDAASVKKAVEEMPEDHVDLLILSAGEHSANDGDIRQGHDCEELLCALQGNVICATAVVEAALPLMRAGEGKRIAVLTEKKASINESREESDYGYAMSAASLNMMEHILFNRLHPEGFTFRSYAAAEGEGGMSAATYFTQNLCYDANDAYIHSDENRLVMRDGYLREIPW